MLTADLVRVKMYRDEVRPRYVEANDDEVLLLAATIIEIFEQHVGLTRGELESDLKDFLGAGTDFLLHRGLAKLMFDRTELATEAKLDPIELRREVYESAGRTYMVPDPTPTSDESDTSIHTPPPFEFDRSAVVREICERHDLTEEAFERNLYADLKDEQVLQPFDKCTPEWLIKRYNVALAQGVLLKASDMKINVRGQTPAKYRALFRKIKFFQLLHRVTGTNSSGYQIFLDGPLSLFKSSQKYGMQMASFLPTLLHFDEWDLEANLVWGKKRAEKRFKLSSEAGLQSHTSLTAQWQPEEMSWLPEQFKKLESDWTISSDTKLINLKGRGVVVPDYVFKHAESGTQVFMEIFGFWRKTALEPRINELKAHGPQNLILAVSQELNTDKAKLADVPAEIYAFRSVPLAKDVLAKLNKFL